MIIGFSTGCFYKLHKEILKKIEEVKATGCEAIELLCDNEKDIQILLKEMPEENLAQFKYISLHTPKLNNYSVSEIGDILESIQELHEKLNLKCVVIHPDEVRDWEVFSKFSFPIAIENMDNVKSSGRTVEEMREVFKLCDRAMLIDLMHSYSDDQTMKLGRDLVDIFKSRIIEIHLSGYAGSHAPLYQTKQKDIIESVPSNVPIIIESVFEDIHQVRQELEYIKSHLEAMN